MIDYGYKPKTKTERTYKMKSIVSSIYDNNIIKTTTKPDQAYYTLGALKCENQLFDSKHGVNNFDVNKANHLIDIISRYSNSHYPKPGDCILVEYYGDNKEYKAHIESKDNEMGFNICTIPYTPFASIGPNDSARFNTSGGPWFYEKNTENFEFLGFIKKTFKTWGSCGMCGEGAFYFDAIVSCWNYKGINHK